jgi:hypothetical protein
MDWLGICLASIVAFVAGFVLAGLLFLKLRPRPHPVADAACAECGGRVVPWEGFPPLVVCGQCCASRLDKHAPGCPADPARN